MPSLVKKWQSIQKELDEEEKSSSSDEDRDQLNKKSIEDWKHQQILTYVRLNMATVQGGYARMKTGFALKWFLFLFTGERLQRMPTLKHYQMTGEIE